MTQVIDLELRSVQLPILQTALENEHRLRIVIHSKQHLLPEAPRYRL